MRKIDIPITQTVSASLDLRNFRPDDVVDSGNGQLVINLGDMVSEEILATLEVARTNGGLVLYGTTSIEKQIESFLLVFFMGPFLEPDPRRDLFEREVLESSALSFSAKKNLLAKTLNEEQLLSGKQKNKLQSNLKKIMVWRNAFAHGRVQHDVKRGACVKYYSGGPEELVLNEQYWVTVEAIFKETDMLIKEAKAKLQNA